jgi:hypothetical protein
MDDPPPYQLQYYVGDPPLIFSVNQFANNECLINYVLYSGTTEIGLSDPII